MRSTCRRDGAWDLQDRLLGNVARSGGLAVGATYTGALNNAVLPPAKAGQYRIIVRPDIFNEVYEGVDERNNATASRGRADGDSAGTASRRAARHHAVAGRSEAVPRHRRRERDAARRPSTPPNAGAANEIYVRYGDVPEFGRVRRELRGSAAGRPDRARSRRPRPGDYYVLVRSSSSPARQRRRCDCWPNRCRSRSPTCTQDQGGDSRWVTMTIDGCALQARRAGQAGAPGPRRDRAGPLRGHRRDHDHRHLRLPRAGARPVRRQGDQSGRRRGGGAYRYLVERALPIDVTIGLGGPRVLPPGQTGLYGISLQSLTNVDTPYVYFEFGAPEMGDNASTSTACRTSPSIPTCAARRTACAATCPGRASIRRPTRNGWSITLGLRVRRDRRRLRRHELHGADLPGPEGADRPRFRGRARALWPTRRPDWVKDGTFEARIAGLIEIASDPDVLVPGKCVVPFIPFRFNVMAAATPMTRAEFVARQTAEALKLRTAVLADGTRARWRCATSRRTRRPGRRASSPRWKRRPAAARGRGTADPAATQGGDDAGRARQRRARRPGRASYPEPGRPAGLLRRGARLVRRRSHAARADRRLRPSRMSGEWAGRCDSRSPHCRSSRTTTSACRTRPTSPPSTSSRRTGSTNGVANFASTIGSSDLVAARPAAAVRRRGAKRHARVDQRPAGLRRRPVRAGERRRCPTRSASRIRPTAPAPSPRSASSRSSTHRSTRARFRLGDLKLGDINVVVPGRPRELPGRLRLPQFQGLRAARVRRHRPEHEHRQLGAAGDRPGDRRSAAGWPARPAAAEQCAGPRCRLRQLHRASRTSARRPATRSMPPRA